MNNKAKTALVYVLVDESIANRVKVGFTSGRPEDRARELHTYGVPTSYKIATAFCPMTRQSKLSRECTLGRA